MNRSAIRLTHSVETPRPSRTRVLAATTLGNALEFFDFAVYAFFAVTIGKLLFRVSSTEGQQLLPVATFGVGFIGRPLGGIYFGQYAARHGRKAAMTLHAVPAMTLVSEMLPQRIRATGMSIATPGRENGATIG